MFGSEFNGEPPARAMGVPPRGAPFVSSGFTVRVSANDFLFLPVSAGAALFLLGSLMLVSVCFFLFLLALVCPLQAHVKAVEPSSLHYQLPSGLSLHFSLPLSRLPFLALSSCRCSSTSFLCHLL